MGAGTLYLVPSDLGAPEPAGMLPTATRAIVHRVRHFIAENPKTARRFLKAVGYPHPLRDTVFDVLDEHTPASALGALLAPLERGVDVALVSEAGCPGVADPGANLVRLAHSHGIRVVPLVGPSAILLALMASGMNGQRFTFHGYLPASADERRRHITQLENRSAREDATQMFIETPYRNEALLDALLQTCRDETLLCIAADLTGATEFVRTQTIARWKRNRLDLKRRPAVFLLYCGAS
jgi:16S rRNA (cytidine1402-2'-O)-methyltransferase